jgi:ABC-type transport system involved in multi-copper enzyme maturation permease subunit
MRASLQRIRLIAANTYQEGVRQKFFQVVFFVSVGLLLSANFFQQFDFGTSELKFILDFGFGAVFFLGSFLAIAVMAQLFFNEIEHRTVLTLLAKPVYKVEYLLGKFVGAQLLMLTFVLVVSLLLFAMLHWRASVLTAAARDSVESVGVLRYGDIFVYNGLQWVRFCVIGAFTLLIGSFSNSNLYTLATALCVLTICQLQYLIRRIGDDMAIGPAQIVAQSVAWLFPNFQIFNVGDQLVLGPQSGLAPLVVLQISGYGLIYTIAYTLLAYLIFRQREI